MTVDFLPTRAALVALTMLSCCMARAGEAAPDASVRWSLGGFGTVGAVHSNEDQADFTANVLNPGNAGYSHAWSATVDSRAGMQLGAEWSSSWSAVLQLVSERTLQSGYAPAVEWANIKYQATPDFSVRAGRIALPLLLTGDYRKAGYALPWVRPPVELYGAIPISNSDGIDASYRWQAGDSNNITQAFFGRTSVSVSPTAHARARAITGLSNTATSGALTVRASAMSAVLTVDVAQALFDGLRQFGAQGAALVDRYDLDARRADVASLGFSYEPGDWFVMGEVGRLYVRSYLGDKRAAYLSGGYRYGNLTPYASYAVARAHVDASAGLALAGLPLPLAAAGAQLNAGLDQLLAAIPRQHTASAGLRWDMCRNHALKLQYDRVAVQQGSTGAFINVQPDFHSGHAVSVLSAAVDFVF